MEIKRILTSPKNILCFFICLFLACMFFVYECSIDKHITLQGEDLVAYIESYPDFIASVQNNADSYGVISSMLEGLPYENIIKTAHDYSKLDGIELSYGENRGIVLFSGFLTADMLLVVLVVFIVSSLFEENKKGLGFLVRSTKYGRQHLFAQRMAAVLLFSLAFTFLVCTGCMTISYVFFGSSDVVRALQSIPEFRLCSLPVTIAEYLLYSCLIKAFAASTIGLTLYLLSAVFDSIIATAVSIILVITEYLSYIMIAPTDLLAGMKFCNIIALLRTDVFFRNYLNLNFFGKAVGFLNAALIVFGVFFIVLAVLSTVFAAGNFEGYSIGQNPAEKIRRAVSKKEPSGGLALWELKKVFIGQKGLIIFAAVIYLTVYSSMQYSYVYTANPIVERYYNKYGGVITEELTERITKERIACGETIDLLAERYEAAVENGDKIASKLFVELQTAINNFIVLEKIEAQAISGLEYSKESGITVDLIKPDAYEMLLARDIDTTKRNSMYILYAMIGIFSGIIARERQSNMMEVQRSVKRGRCTLTLMKAAIMSVTGITLSVLINAVQLVQIGYSVGYNDLGVAVQSLEIIRGVPIPITIAQYLLLIFVLRALAAVVVGIAVMVISRCSLSTLSSMCMSFLILVIPAVLDSLGITWLISVTDILAVSLL